jgi:dienelactone hydrolase
MSVFWRFLLGLSLALACAASGRGQTAERVTFAGDGVTLQGWLYAPATPGPHPAVVALHGCAGLEASDGKPGARHDDWGRRLSAEGALALFPDSFGSRGLGPQCRNDEREVRPSRERVADAEAALRFLVARADVDPKAVSLLGWSNGGSTTLYAVEPKHAPTGVDFARAIAFYPGCRLPLEHGWKSRLPLLLLIGAADDWTPAAPCQQLVDEAKARGESADIVVYANAYHDFDHPNLPVHEVKHLAFTAAGTGAAHTGTNPEARADAIKRVETFLALSAKRQD